MDRRVMKLLVTLSLACVVWCAADSDLDPMSDEFIAEINRRAVAWRAGRNFAPDVPFHRVQRMMGGVVDDPDDLVLPTVQHELSRLQLPESFDARDRWPECPTIGDIRDQGSCGSCWAVSSTEVMSDRVCIHSNGTRQRRLSDQDMMTCCTRYCHGCYGGPLGEAWQYWIETGVVTGGPYNSHQGCRPYSVEACEHDVDGPLPPCIEYTVDTPPCTKRCDAAYNMTYAEDLQFGASSYRVRGGERQIMAEIFTNGPVQAGMEVYPDFVHYRSGVYRHVFGDSMSRHAVKILGWGVDGSVPYWLVANSFNRAWGDNGYFKILRGQDHCSIEKDIYAGMPKLD